MIADLKELVNQESPSKSVRELSLCAATLAATFERVTGKPAEIIDSVDPARGPHVHWRGGSEPKVLILGHYDTVFPKGTIDVRPFRFDNGVATGPGVFDMKAAIIQAVYAISVLDETVKSGVEVLFTSDEEIGSASSKALLIERAHAAGNVLVLEPSADGGALKTARKGTGTFEIVFEGRASHAGLEPEKGINALVEMAAQIPVIAALAKPELGTTVTPTVASAGTADNVVPAQARLFVDVRVEAAGEKERIENAIAKLTPTVEGCVIKVLGGIGRPPMPASASESLFALAQRCGVELGLGQIEGVAVGGGSDGNFTAAAGIPTLDGLGAVGGSAHGEAEHVLVEEMPKRAALLAALMHALAA
jgi:glutamate carboxypeptidase